MSLNGKINNSEKKLKIEDCVLKYYKNDNIETLLEFIKYLKLNKITIKYISEKSWKILFKSKYIASLNFNVNTWFFNPEIDYNINNCEEYIKNNKLENIIWNNIKICTNCKPKGKCNPIHSSVILGKIFNNICGVCPKFKNPNEFELDGIKKLVEYRKDLIVNNKIPKVHYIGGNKMNELSEKYGELIFKKGYEVFRAYYYKNPLYESDKFYIIYDTIERNNPKIHPLKLLEMGLFEYSKTMK